MEVSEAALGRLGPSERAQAESLLESLRRLREENPLQFFVPYPKQERFLGAGVRTKAFFGGNRAGKTEIGIVDDLVQAVDRDCLPAALGRFKLWEPPFFCRVVTPGFGINESVVLDKLRHLCPKSQLAGGSWERAYKKEAIPILRFANGSWIQFLTSEQDVDKHSGARLHRVHFDEEPPGEHGFQIYRENRMRLIDFGGQAMFTMTPLMGLSWMYDEIWERRDEDGVFCIVASMLDNPHLPREVVEEELAQMRTKEEREARAGGQFVHFQGVVLAEFDDDTHLVDPPGRGHVQGLEVLVGIDPGVARGGVVWVGFDRDNTALVFDELYPSGLTVPQIVAAIRERNEWWGIDPATYVVDPSARNRSLTDAESVSSLLMQEGVFPVPGQNDRKAGILEMKRRLVDSALLVSRGCVMWLREQRRWVVVKDERSGEQDNKSGKGAASGIVTKGPDHLMDPTRYVLMERLWTASGRSEAVRNPLGLPEHPRAGWAPAWVPQDRTDYGPLGEAI